MNLHVIRCDACKTEVELPVEGWSRFQYRFDNDVDADPVDLCHDCTCRMRSAINGVFLGGVQSAPAPVLESIDTVEQRHVVAVLGQLDWNKSKAALTLGIERSTLDRKLKLWKVTRPAIKAGT